MSTVQSQIHTPAELLAMPDANSIELIDGELVEKPVSVLSALVEGKLLMTLGNFCQAHRTGVVLSSTNGIQCFPWDARKVRKPDVSYFKRERFTADHLQEGFVSIPPDLAVEVISFHDEFAEINEKIEDYLSAGIPLIWIIDPENELAYIHRIDGTVTKLRKNNDLDGETIIPGFRCKLAELFPSFESNPV